MDKNDPCAGCALSKGAEANREHHNHLRAQLCVLSGIPFYCHAAMDWRNIKSGTEPRTRGLRLCAGWRREVRALAAVGYYKTHRLIKRLYGALGLEALEQFTEGEGEVKEAARRALDGVCRALGKERRKATRKGAARR